MRTPRLLSAVVLLLAISAVAQTTNPIVDYAYVGTRANKIYAYAIHKNGENYSLSGSPFSGAGAYLTNTSSYVFASNGTNIVTYLRSSGGSIRPIASINGIAHNDTPTGSGVGVLTLDRTGATLYAGEIDFQGADNNAFAEFAKQSNGSLTFKANTPINVNYAGYLTFSHDNKFAYGSGCYFITWQLFGLYRNSTTGLLTPFDTGNTVIPNQSGDNCPGAVASSARGYLAVAYNVISTTTNRIAIYQITSSGALKLISTNATSFTGIGSMKFDPTGNYLAVGGNNGLAVYRLTSSASLTKVSGRVATTTNFVSVQWDNFWHVLATSYSHFEVFNARYGVLSQVGSSHPVYNATNVSVLPIQ